MRLACRVASQILERTGALLQPASRLRVDRAAASFIGRRMSEAPF